MTHLIIGTDDAAIAALRSQLREADPTSEIQLKSARDFDPEAPLSDALHVHIVGNFPEIVAAYGDRAQVFGQESPEVVTENVDTQADVEVAAVSKKRSTK